MRVLILTALLVLGTLVAGAPAATASHDCTPFAPGASWCESNPCAHDSWDGHVQVWFIFSACWRIN